MKDIVKKELNKLNPLGVCNVNDKFLIYSTNIQQSPNIVIEIAKKRAIAFSAAGVKVKSPDLDQYDVCGEHPQSQMFICDTKKDLIVGGYRYSYNSIIPPQHSPMGKSFNFTEEFTSQNWIQLGRSFISREYQNSRYGIPSLMNGLGCLFANAKNPEGFFGKVTIPYAYEQNGATHFVASFCKHHWQNGFYLGQIKEEYAREVSPFGEFSMSHVDLKGDHKEFIERLKKEYQMPGLPILKIYDSLADGFKSIHYLGAFVHEDFGGATEIGMAIHRNNISSKAKKAHIEPYL